MERFNNRTLCKAFGSGVSNASAGTALRIENGVLMSYAEPIAVYVGGIVHLTTARFSVTTSKHRSYAVSGAVAARAADGMPTNPSSDYIVDTDHADIRRMASDRGVSCGSWGAHYV